MAGRLKRGALREYLSISFDQPVGPRISRDGVRGYYNDLRVKAKTPVWPPAEMQGMEPESLMQQVLAQWGLGAYEHWLETGREEWLSAARAACGYFLETQLTSGPQAGGWPHRFAYPYTFRLDPPWLSAMAQGEIASLLVRVHAETGEDALAEAALRGMQPMHVASADGGVQAEFEGGPFFEEYPTSPASYVLNGGIFALWGLYDVAVALDDAESRRLFDAGLEALAAGIHRWDMGYWTSYDLYPHRRTNIASSAYQQLHVDQLAATNVIAPRPALVDAERRFRKQWESRLNRARAFAAKVAFRLAVPRREGTWS